MKRILLGLVACAFGLAVSIWPSSIGKPGGGGGGSQGLYAAAPACNGAASGVIYFATDAGLEGECNGTAWLWHYGNFVVSPTTSAATSIWYNQQCCGGAGEAFVSNNGAGSSVLLQAGVWGNDQVQGRLRVVPSTPYTYRVCMSSFNGQSNAAIGLMWADGTNNSTSKLAAARLITLNNFGIGSQFAFTKYTNATSVSAEYSVIQGQRPTADLGFPKCFALVDNGTLRKVAWSTDGSYWFNENYAAVSNTDFLTPTHIGYFVNANGSQAPVQINVFSEEVIPSALF